jgi:hypothetical protein
MRISCTTRSCTYCSKVYRAYRLAEAFSRRQYRWKSPSVSYSHSLLHRFQPNPRAQKGPNTYDIIQRCWAFCISEQVEGWPASWLHSIVRRNRNIKFSIGLGSIGYAHADCEDNPTTIPGIVRLHSVRLARRPQRCSAVIRRGFSDSAGIRCLWPNHPTPSALTPFSTTIPFQDFGRIGEPKGKVTSLPDNQALDRYSDESR